MPKVFKICISDKSDNKMQNVDSVEAISGKGILNDRYFQDNNSKETQITLIESENIDYYNSVTNENISYIEFRRNIITKGIELNDLIDKKIKIGEVIIVGHQLCEPCLDLQKKLNQDNFVKNLVHKGGLRAEILESGKISVNDEIEILN